MPYSHYMIKILYISNDPQYSFQNSNSIDVQGIPTYIIQATLAAVVGLMDCIAILVQTMLV